MISRGKGGIIGAPIISTLQLYLGEVMGNDSDYFWVVLCKNRAVHNRDNLYSCHCIPLVETDAISPPPEVIGALTVRCDECGREYDYKANDLLRAELTQPETFTPHPQLVGSASNGASTPFEVADVPISVPGRTVMSRIRAAISPSFLFRDRGYK